MQSCHSITGEKNCLEGVKMENRLKDPCGTLNNTRFTDGGFNREDELEFRQMGIELKTKRLVFLRNK